jgi:putative transposase
MVRLKEKGFKPTNAKVRSCTLLQKANRFYVSAIAEEPDPQVVAHTYIERIEVDLGLKYFVKIKISNGQEFKNIIKSPAVSEWRSALRVRNRGFSTNSNPKEARCKICY